MIGLNFYWFLPVTHCKGKNQKKNVHFIRLNHRIIKLVIDQKVLKSCSQRTTSQEKTSGDCFSLLLPRRVLTVGFHFRSLVLEGSVPEHSPLHSGDPTLPEQCVVPGSDSSCTAPLHHVEPCGGKGEPKEAGRCSGHDFCSRKADTFECPAFSDNWNTIVAGTGDTDSTGLIKGVIILKVYVSKVSLPYWYRIS